MATYTPKSLTQLASPFATETIDVQKKIRAKKPGFWQKPGFSSPNDYLNFYS